MIDNMQNMIIKKIKNIYMQYPIEITALVVCSLGYILYVSLVYSVEVLFLASFSGDVQLVGKFLDGSMIPKDLLRKFGEHGMLGYDILLLVNTYFFQYSSRFDLVLNCLNVIICAGFTIALIYKNTTCKSVYYYVGILLVSVVMFSTMQGSSATMETQVRLGLMFFLFSSYFVSEIFVNKTKKNTLFYGILLIILSINVFGTLYNFAAIPMVFLIAIILTVKERKFNIKYFLIILAYIFSAVLYCYMYKLFDNVDIRSGSILTGTLFWLNHPMELMKAILAWNGSTVLGYSVIADKIIPDWLYLSIGATITTIYLTSIILFIKVKMYKKTMLPMLLIGYSFAIIFLILVGRYTYADWMWGTSFWYHVHTKLGLAASIWIYIFACSSEKPLNSTISTIDRRNYYITLAWISFIMITAGLSLGIISDLRRAPNVRNWYENIASYMSVDESEMPVDKDGNTPLLADRVTTRACLQILKKYHLSLFSHPPKYIKPSNELLYTSKLVYGNYSSDRWISKTIKANMNTGIDGMLVGKINIPNKYVLPNKISIFLDNQEVYSNKYLAVGDYSFKIHVQPGKDVVVKINMDKAIIPKKLNIGEDQRELSVILKSFVFL